MADVTSLLEAIVPTDRLLAGDAAEDYTHDEALGGQPQTPACVVFPISTDEVSAILRVANEHGVAVTARGSGTGLSGAAIPVAGGLVVSFERMNRIIEIDAENQVAVVEPGVTLAQLEEATAGHGLVYPVFPGEYSASIGGNVGTNAGGMRAVKYGVTRHQVLGLEAVLASGEVIRTGGRFVKGSTGYDLTQLVVGSEGTLALVTEAILKLYPRLPHQATVMAPFRTLEDVMRAVPRIVGSGIGPLILEYIDMLTLAGMERNFGLELGVPEAVRAEALAYLVVMMENRIEARLDEDVLTLSEQLVDLGAVDVYVLPPQAGVALISAREKAFWLAKSSGADDIVDVAVPRAAIADFMEQVAALAAATGTFVAGCGHAGDGNVHLSVFQPDGVKRSGVLHDLFAITRSLRSLRSSECGGAGLRPALNAIPPVDRRSWLDPQPGGSGRSLRPPDRPPRGRRFERRTGTITAARGRGRRYVLHEPGDLGDALRRRARLGRRAARRARAVRRRRHRCRRRVRSHDGSAGGHPPPPRTGPRQRPRQPPQRPAGAHPGRQHRRRSRGDPRPVRRAAAIRHRGRRRQRVGLGPAVAAHRGRGR